MVWREIIRDFHQNHLDEETIGEALERLKHWYMEELCQIGVKTICVFTRTRRRGKRF
jgi:hypothetical protein